MNAIVCVDSNWSIGKDNDLLIHIPEDMKFFKAKTIGNVVIMGRKTLQSLPNGPLENRINIILSKNPSPIKDEIYVSSIEELLNLVKQYKSEDVFVIGGGSIYKQLLPYCDLVYVTKVYKNFEADTTFPNLSEDLKWRIEDVSPLKEYKEIQYNFFTYRRIKYGNL